MRKKIPKKKRAAPVKRPPIQNTALINPAVSTTPDAGPPKPSAEFREAQAALRRLTESRSSDPAGQERERLKDILRAEFEAAFGLTSDRGGKTERFYHRHGLSSQQGFDHTSFYRRGPNLVVVSQPYGVDAKVLALFCEYSNATYTPAEDWAFYYPGHATCFFVEFGLGALVKHSSISQLWWHWITQQRERRDPIGDVARDIWSDFETEPADLINRRRPDIEHISVLLRYLKKRGACAEALEAARTAWGEFLASEVRP